jgi:cation transport ATPase
MGVDGRRRVTTASPTGRAGPAPKVSASRSGDVICLFDEDLFGERLAELGIELVRRIFAIEDVACVQVDRAKTTAWVRRSGDGSGLYAFLEKLAKVIRGGLAGGPEVRAEGSLPDDLQWSHGVVAIRRVGTILTTWQTTLCQPGRIGLAHVALRGDGALAGRIEAALRKIAGVTQCEASPVSGSVVIDFDSSTVDAPRLLRALDAVRRPAPWPADQAAGARRPGFALSNTSLALAIGGELAVPALLPASAALLVGSNLDTFAGAWRELRRGKLGMPALYTGIVAATVASGQYVFAAAMSWMLVFWRRRYQADLDQARRGLLGDLIDPRRTARLATAQAGGVDVERLVDELKPEDVIVVPEGGVVPVDGRAVAGCALADERLVCGSDGLVRKQAGDLVWAGSTLRAGELHVAVVQEAALSRGALLARSMAGALAPASGTKTPTRHGEAFAEQTVGPTFAVAGLGLLVGDASTAVAIMRPDYATGPGLAFPLESLQALALCLRHGIVIRNPLVLAQIATADVLVLDHHPALEHAELELDSVEVFPGSTEERVLAYAASALCGLDDERAGALDRACHDRGVNPTELPLVELAPDLTMHDRGDCIKVGELGDRARPSVTRGRSSDGRAGNAERRESLMVGINGRVAGLVHFRRSERLTVAPVLQALRARATIQIGLVSAEAPAVVAPLAAALGCDFHLAGQTASDRLRFLRHCRQHGYRTVYVGDCRGDRRLAAEAHAAVSVLDGGAADIAHDPAPVCLLQPRLTKLGVLWDVAGIHYRRLRVAHGYALVPNLFCVAGIFAWGFTSAASVLLSNLGTYGIYSRTKASLATLDREIARSFGPRPPVTGEDRRVDRIGR